MTSLGLLSPRCGGHPPTLSRRQSMLSFPLGGMSRIRRLVALTLVLAAPFAAAAAQGTGTGTIRGRVTDAATARAISDAQITITGTQLSAATTINGDFAIVNVPSGAREV